MEECSQRKLVSGVTNVKFFHQRSRGSNTYQGVETPALNLIVDSSGE